MDQIPLYNNLKYNHYLCTYTKYSNKQYNIIIIKKNGRKYILYFNTQQANDCKVLAKYLRQVAHARMHDRPSSQAHNMAQQRQ